MYIGVDFGTSFSQAATLHNGTPLVLLHNDTYGIPSEFYHDSDIGIQIGQDALDYAEGINAKYLVSESKMKLLQQPDYVSLDGRNFTYPEIVKQIYRCILQTSQNIAERKLIKHAIEGMVLTMPVRFGYQEKSILKEAAETCMGGSPLRVIHVLKEPVAAAIAYYQDSLADGKNILVFDLGGGTCDVALVRSDKSQHEMFTVLDDGMERVGGRDWDLELMKFISSKVEEKTGVRIIDHDIYKAQLRNKAVELKKQLSSGMSTTGAARIAMQNGSIVTVPVSLGTFEEITCHLMRKALGCLTSVYEKNISKYVIDEIICVGGSSNMPQVRRSIQNAFPEIPVRLYDPEHAVVNGAAIFADLIKFAPDPVIADVATFSYGIRSYKDYLIDPNKFIITNLIIKGQTLPVSGENNYSPVTVNQSCVSFSIFESEYTNRTYDPNSPNTLIGTVTFPLPPNCPTSHIIHCTITLKPDGFLYFSATDNTGRNVPAKFQLSR